MIVAAHRGLSSLHAENTLVAFRAAIDAGFKALELDVRRSADGEVVVLHDAGVDRTTDGTGRIADMQYDEVASLRTADGPVPRLDDLLAACADWDGLWDVEIKDHRCTADVVALLRQHNLLGRAVIASIDPRALQVALERAPEVPRALITLGPVDVDDMEIATANQCTWLHADQDFLTLETVDKIRAAGLQVGAWTVNDVERAHGLVEHGVAMIITDLDEVREQLGT